LNFAKKERFSRLTFFYLPKFHYFLLDFGLEAHNTGKAAMDKKEVL